MLQRKGVCEKDLTKQPNDPGWKNYCPNAVSLKSFMKLKGSPPSPRGVGFEPTTFRL